MHIRNDLVNFDVNNQYITNHKMKKALLSAAAVAATVMTGWANEYTFVFDGENDLGGLTRQTSTKEAELTFTDSFSLSEEGIELSVRKASGDGPGLALINAGGSNAGLCVYSTFSKGLTPEIALTVPGGKITSVKLSMSGSGLSSLDIPFNGATIEATNENTLYSWTWKDSEGAESVSCSWLNTYYQRYIHSIEVVYTPDLGGKLESGLSFPLKEYEAILGESFLSPTLSNPNKLNVSWSSSNEAVATVSDNGKVTLIGRGNATITATTEGNDEYAAGNAKYDLCVIPSASNIAQLLEYAPEVYDRVKVNFPATVNFANASIAFVTDAEGNAACFDNISNRNSTSTTVTTIYSTGQVIPAGWIATNATIYESVIWEGKPDKVTETVDVTYPEVSSVTSADADRVVILKNVTFETRTAVGTTKAYGTTPDGTRYEFQDTYEIAGKEPGTYDVTCVVRYSRRGSSEYFYLSPISYSESSVETPQFPESFDISVSFEGAEVTQGEQWSVYTVSISGTASEDTYTVSLAVPEGWDGFIGMTDIDMESEAEPAMSKVQTPEWLPVDYMLENGMKKGNTLTFPADGQEHMGFLYLCKGDQVDVANVVQIETTVEKEVSGVESIEAKENAEYYDLNGLRRRAPGKGIHIKVSNGKAVIER